MVGLRRLAYRVAYQLLILAALVRVPRGPGVKAVLVCRGEVLLVRHTYGPHRWELPGGGVRRREEPAAAVAREIEEELGLSVAGAVEIGELLGAGRMRRYRTYIYRVELEQPRVRPDPVEIAEAAWFDPAQPPDLMGPFVAWALRLVGAEGAVS